MSRFVLGAAIIVSATVLVACQPASAPENSATSESTTQMETTLTTSPMATPDAATSDMVQEKSTQVVDVKGDDFSFDVKEIRVKQGDQVTVRFTNTEGFHDFVIDELNVNTGMVAVGSTKEVMIPTDKPGTYEYYCSVGEHRARGMKGTLIIE